MKVHSIGAQGFKNIPVFASSAIIAAIYLFFSASGASAQGSGAATSGSLHENPAAAVQSQVAANHQVQLEGELEIMYQDSKDGRSHRLLYSLKRSDGTRVALQFAKEPPTHLLSGDHVRAIGQLSGGSMILYSGSASLKRTTTTSTTTTAGDATGTSTPSIPVPNTFGTQSTLVILVNFQDYAIQPYATADAQTAVFGTASDFFLENSYGQTSLTGTVVGWYTIPVSVTTCDTAQIGSAAQNAAAAAGVNLSAYTRYVYAFPQNNACGFAGASYVGGNPSQSWVNGSSLDVHIIDHELGHAFGLWHSHLLDCGTAETIGSVCAVDEYGDILDTMGAPQPPSPHYNSFQKERLGWLNYGNSPSIQTVQTSGTYTINPYEQDGSGPTALKILKSTDPTTGVKTWYYLEARQAVGFDSFLTTYVGCEACYTQNETTGVLLHIGTDGDGNSGDLLDMTPATVTYHWWFDPSLVPGQSFQDSTAGVTFTPIAVSSTGAQLQITINGSAACSEANPTVAVSPSQSQSVISGTAVSFTLTVTNNDSSACAPVTFNLGDALPSGWSGSWNTSVVSLYPGKSGSATFTATSPVGTADGSYGVGVSAANALAASYSGSASAAYVINTTTPLTIGLATNQSNYLPGQTVTILVTMLYGTTADAGAGVTVRVTTPSGRATSLTGTTGSNGVASLSYKLSNHATAGTYQAQLATTVKGASSSNASSTSFTVQ